MGDRQSNYTIMEGCELPSGGKIYDVEVNPHVELRSMTARDEMKRLSPSSTPLKTLADIIEGCLVEKPAIHVYDMAMSDYEFLLMKLRIVTYGPKYKVNPKCNACGEWVEADADLEALEIVPFDEDTYNEVRTFTLPNSGKTITLKNNTPHLLETIETKVKEMKRKFKNAALDFETYCKITCNIDSVNGEPLKGTEIDTFIQELSALDMQKILNQIDKLPKVFGLQDKLEISCPECGEDINLFFRYGPEFFRPTNI